MNFKEWLLLTEANKDINLSNPKLTSTIPLLNTIVSNPKLAKNNTQLNASVSNPNSTTTKISNRELASNKRVEALAIRYKQLGTGEYPPEFRQFLSGKRRAYRAFIKGIKSKDVWYPSDIKIARVNGLPDNWMYPQMEVVKSKNEQKSNENFKELAYYFGRNNAGPSVSHSNLDIAYLGRWLNEKKGKRNLNEKSDDKTWAEIVSKFPNWIDPLTKKPFLYKDLPKDWRIIKPSKQQEIEQENRSENFKKLAYYFGRNNAGPSRKNKNPDIVKLAKFQHRKKNKKRNPHEESLDNKTWAEFVKLSKTENWIDPLTKKPFPYKNLPDDWRDVKSNAWQEYLQKKQENSSENFKELAYYFGRNNARPSVSDSNLDIAYLGRWYDGKKYSYNRHEKSDDKTWAEIVSKFPNWIDPLTKKPFLYKDLPKDWRIIEPAGEKSLGEKYVLSILTELGIKNKKQYRDAACKNKICLPFDFSIIHNGKKYLLEYNGLQHYIPAYFGSKEDMTDQEKAKSYLKQFKYIKGNDTIKYEHCEKGKIPFLVIPYWLYKNKNQDIIKSRIKQFLETNEFNQTFANPDVPKNYKAYHDRIFKITKCFASGKVNCKELFKKQKTTFEQFLINKNFTYYNA